MADLKGNTQYGDTAPAKIYPKLNINPGGSRRPTSSVSGQVYTAGNAAANTALKTDAPIAPRSEFHTAPVPEDYSSFKPNAQFPYEKNAGLITPATPTLHQMPDASQGQYVYDQAAPTSLIKSNREFVTQDEKAKILGPLPSSLFQVDHIIPLWAGGADTPQNLSILPIGQHAMKTKAQAVALTLLANKKIDFSTAKVMAMNWRDKDLTGIPQEGENGLIDLKSAEEIKQRWDYQAIHGKPVTLTDVAQGIPEAMKDFGKGWLPNPVREFVKGAVSGVTGGIVGYQPGEDETGIDKGAGIAGNIVGSIFGIGKFSKFLMPVLAKTGWKAFAPGAKLGLASLAPAEAIAATAVKAAPTTLAGKAFSKLPYESAIKYLQTKAADNIIRNTAVLGSYGVLTGGIKFGLSNKEADDVQELATRLGTDLGLGVITGGLANNWKGSAGVGVGTLILGQMLGESPEDSLVNSLTMAGLHKLGSIKPMKTDTAKMQASIEEEATGVAHNLLHWWGGKGIPKMPVGENVTSTVDQNDVFNWTQKALTNLDDFALSGRNGTELNLKNNMNLETYNEYRSQILSAGRHLYKTTLPAAEREAADMADLVSMASSLKDKTYLQKGGMTLPDSVPTFAEKAGRSILIDNTVRPTTPLDPTLPVGEMPLRGLGVNAMNEEIGNAYVAAKARGQTSEYVLMVTRPDAEPVFRRMNDTFAPEEIAAGNRRASQNPGKSVQAFAVMKDPQTGEPMIGPELGWWPRKFTIDESTQSLNNHPLIKSGKFAKNNPELNKDTIFDAAEKNGTPVFLAKVSKADVGRGTDISAASGKPYVVLQVTPETWALSKDISNGTSSAGPVSSIPAAIGRIKGSVSSSEVSKNIAAASEKARATETDAATVLERSPIADTEGLKPAVVAYTKRVGEVLQTSRTPEELVNNLRELGINLDGPMVDEVFIKKGDIKARQILGLLKSSVDNETASPEMAAFFESTIRPFIRNASSRDSLGKAWGEMPVAPSRPLEEIPLQGSMSLPTVPSTKPAITPRVEAPVAPQAASAAEAIPTVTGQGAPQNPLAGAITGRVAKGDVLVTPSKGVKPLGKATPIPLAEASGPNTGVPANVPATPSAPSSLLEAAPINIKETARTTRGAAYEEALTNLEQVGMNSGRAMDTRALDEYVTQLISSVKESGLPEKEQKLLARRAIDLLNKEDLTTRDVSSGKSAEAWDKQTAIGSEDRFHVIDEGVGGPAGDNAIGKYFEKQRNRIEEEFGVLGSKKKETTTAISPEEQAVLETELIKNDAKSLISSIPENKKADPTTYQRAHAEAFDAAMKKFFGPNYMKNKDVLSLFSDKSKVFGARWKELMNTSDYNGRDITQPKDVIAALGRGKKASAAIEARKKEVGKAQEESFTTSGTRGAGLDESLDRSFGQKLETDTQGMRVENSTQSASENIKDLTVFESKYQQGLLDEIEAGSDSKLSPVRGIQDAKRQSLLFADMYNEAVRNGLIEGKEVNKKVGGLFRDLEITMRKMATRAETKKAGVDDAKAELRMLIDATNNLRDVGGTRARELARKEMKDNLTRIEELRKITGDYAEPDLEILVKTKAISAKEYRNLGGSEDDATVQKWIDEADAPLDGQGGPGVPIIPPQTQTLGLAQQQTPLVPEKRTPMDFILNRSRMSRSAPVEAPAMQKVDTSGAIKQVADTNAALARMPAITPIKPVASKPSGGISAFLSNAKANLFPTTVLGGGGIAARDQAAKAKEASPVILGIDTTSYATDPNHAVRLNTIVATTSALSNAAEIEQYIRTKFPKSPLTGSMVATASKKYGVPAPLLLAIVQQDSSMGTAGLGAKTKNPGNVGNDDAGNIRRYASWDEGVNAVAAWMAKNRAQGRTS